MSNDLHSRAPSDTNDSLGRYLRYAVELSIDRGAERITTERVVWSGNDANWHDER